MIRLRAVGEDKNPHRTLREAIKAVLAMIETTRRSMQQTRRVLDRSAPAVNRGRDGGLTRRAKDPTWNTEVER